ncbi:MAG TPA: SMP-30/gluconolactonase/LRE family protein [Candidatus Limnocylindrales bacterium]
MPTDQQSEIPAPNQAPMPAELVLDAHAELAEGPLWDVERQVLWWVDITAGRVHRFDPATGADAVVEIGRPVGCVALCEDGGLVVAAPEALLALNPETGVLEPIARFAPGPVPLRCNDGTCDPQGRFWIDRLALDRAPGASSLVRLGAPGPVSEWTGFETVLRGLTIPNGLDWSADGKRMYFVDSPTRVVSVFDFDATSGAIANGRPFAHVDTSLGLPASAVPDGLTVDEEDCLWVAVWGGGCVLRFTADGSLLARIDIPVARVSSCAFGGTDLTELFITTAWEDATPDELAAQPSAGGIFRARPGVRGRPAGRLRQGA